MPELRAETPKGLLDGAGRLACYRLDPALKWATRIVRAFSWKECARNCHASI